MPSRYEHRLAQIFDAARHDLFTEAKIGLEKESLRVDRYGQLAQSAHPIALGSALTNPYITTDYSEALIEFITPPGNLPDALAFLRDTQQFVYRHLDDELLWATSMPCVVAGETSIPIAKYGTSNAGLMKTVYRRGLGHRYGRVMQVIAGVHFNYSLPDLFWPVFQEVEKSGASRRDFISDAYFGLIRNLQRFGWLIPYLFGASPAVCKSFLHGQHSTLDEFDSKTYYEPYATSLRMGDIGYQNNKENEIGIKACYDSLDKYIESLTCAIETPAPQYEKIGVIVGGEYQQLNTNILQIENEYYSTVRPKQLLDRNEKPTVALRKRGVQYIELRSLDVNAFDPLGINEQQLRFLEAFLLFCLMQESPMIAAREREEIDNNEMITAHRGRDPALTLHKDGKPIALKQWALEICSAMQGVGELLDRGRADRAYQAAIEAQVSAVHDPDLTPSARMLAEMRSEGEAFFEFANRMSEQQRSYFQSLAVDGEREQFFRDAVQSSIASQIQIEQSDTQSFTQYLQEYFAQR